MEQLYHLVRRHNRILERCILKWFIKLGSRLWISPLFLLLAAASLVGGYFELFITAYISAFIHETAHIVTAIHLKIPVARIEILPFGICGRLGVEFIRSPKNELLTAAAGPLTSGFLACVFYIAAQAIPQYTEWLEYGKNINTALMLLNLMPTLPLDGGRMVKAVLSELLGVIRAYNIILKLSRAITALILFAAAALLLISDFNFSLIMIGVFLLGSLSAEQKNISLISLKEILYHKNKLNNSGLCRSERLAAASKTPARKFLRRISSNKYYVIDVIDDNSGKIIKSVTESQVLSALINKSIRLSFGDI